MTIWMYIRYGTSRSDSFCRVNIYLNYFRLNVCVGEYNRDRYLGALVCGFLANIYGLQLAFTTVCHPRLYDIAVTEILLPYTCINAYFDYR